MWTDLNSDAIEQAAAEIIRKNEAAFRASQAAAQEFAAAIERTRSACSATGKPEDRALREFDPNAERDLQRALQDWTETYERLHPGSSSPAKRGGGLSSQTGSSNLNPHTPPSPPKDLSREQKRAKRGKHKDVGLAKRHSLGSLVKDHNTAMRHIQEELRRVKKHNDVLEKRIARLEQHSHCVEQRLNFVDRRFNSMAAPTTCW